MSVLLPAPLGPSRPTAPGRKLGGHVLERPVLAIANAYAIALNNRACEDVCGAEPPPSTD